jgi:hypothetical protein
LATPVVVDAACVAQSHRPLFAGGGDFGVSFSTSVDASTVLSISP